MLSTPYLEIKRLRSTGDGAAAVALLKATAPANDDDAFEAVICLFVLGDIQSSMHIARTYASKPLGDLAAAGAGRAGGRAAGVAERWGAW